MRRSPVDRPDLVLCSRARRVRPPPVVVVLVDGAADGGSRLTREVHAVRLPAWRPVAVAEVEALFEFALEFLLKSGRTGFVSVLLVQSKRNSVKGCKYRVTKLYVVPMFTTIPGRVGLLP